MHTSQNSHTTINSLRQFTFILLSALLLSGCVVTPPPPSSVKVSVLKPTLTPLAETKSSQEKGGVEISIAPVTYTAVERFRNSDRALYDSNKREYTQDGKVFSTPTRIFERTTSSVLVTDPERVKFEVKVNNKMPRVFRGQGMVVQINAAGKLLAVDPRAYAELVQMIVPPRNEQTVYIYGPRISEMPANCPVGLFFYDVVTQQDNAGAITEKQNFEWYFNYATQLEEREGTVTKQRIEQVIGQPVRVK